MAKTIKCEYCHEPFTPARPGQRFCVGKGCRQAWHREDHLTGTVTRICALKNGGWSITVSQAEQPTIKIGTRVELKTTI